MKAPLAEFDRFDAYLSGQMDTETLSQFEAELEGSPALSQRLAAYRLGDWVLRQDRRDRLLQEWDQANPIVVRRLPSSLALLSLGVAAGLFLLLLGSWTLLRLQYANEQLVQAAFMPYPAPGTLMGSNDSVEQSPFIVGMQAYQAAYYQEAIQALSEVAQAHPFAAEAQFYLGVSQLALRQFLPSAETLAGLADRISPAYANAHQWYLALAYLGSDQEQKARRHLEQVEEPYARQATSLLTDLGSNWRRIPGIR